MNASALTIRELREDELVALPELIRLLEPGLSDELVLARMREMYGDGWRCAGCFDGDALVAIAGYSQRCHFFAGRVLFVENMVVRAGYRGRGVGQALMRWLEALARTMGCEKVTLDAYVVNVTARRFYERLGYDARGVHFVLELRG